MWTNSYPFIPLYYLHQLWCFTAGENLQWRLVLIVDSCRWTLYKYQNLLRKWNAKCEAWHVLGRVNDLHDRAIVIFSLSSSSHIDRPQTPMILTSPYRALCPIRSSKIRMPRSLEHQTVTRSWCRQRPTMESHFLVRLDPLSFALSSCTSSWCPCKLLSTYFMNISYSVFGNWSHVYWAIFCKSTCFWVFQAEPNCHLLNLKVCPRCRYFGQNGISV